MKKLLLGLVLLGAISALCVIGYFAVFTDETETDEPLLAPGDGADATAAELPDAAESVSPVQEGRTETVVEEATSERFGAWEEEGERTVTGRVLLPPDVPADPTLRIVALANNLGPAGLYGEHGAATARGRRDRSRVSDALLAVEPVQADGSFAISFPTDLARGWLALDGRHLYSALCTEVDLEPLADGIVVVPQVGGRIAGRLILPAGTDAPQAHYAHAVTELIPDTSTFSLSKVGSGWMFSRKADVAQDGTFEIRAVEPTRAYEVMVGCGGFAAFVHPSFTVAPGRDFTIEARLVAGLTLAGRVVDPDGAPVPGAAVQAKKPIFFGIPAGPQLSATESDEEGQFALSHVSASDVVLVAAHPDYLETFSDVLDLKDGPPLEELVLKMKRGATISGTVRWPDGTPAADADIDVQFDPAAIMTGAAFNATQGGSGRAKSGADGTFVVKKLGKGPFQVTARAIRHEDTDAEEQGRVQRGGIAPRAADLELTLTPPPVLHGRVETEAGDPVTAFRVRADSAGAMMYAAGESHGRDFEDEEGRFTFEGLHEGPWEVYVTAEDFGPSVAATVDLPQPADAAPLLVVLRPPAAVSGFVVDPTGVAVSGAEVTIQVEMNKTIARLEGRMDLPRTRSGEDGSYLLGGLATGEMAVIATHPDYADSAPTTVNVRAAMLTEDVELVLRLGGILTGEVYGKDGEPAGGTSVIIQNASNFVPIIATADPQGLFRVENLTPGSYSVIAMMAGLPLGGGPDGGDQEGEDDGGMGALSNMLGNMAISAAEIRDGEETHVVIGAAPTDPVRVFGQVTHAGDPAGKLMVTFMPEGDLGFGGLKMTETDKEGRYEVELHGPGDVLVTVGSFQGSTGMQQNNVEFSRTIPEGEEHELDFELPGGRISGLVRGPDGEPLPEARITITPEGGVAYGTLWGGQYAEATTRADGRYELLYLREGTYSVAAGGALLGGFLGTKKGPGRQVKSDIRLADGQHLDGVDFRLETPGDITGTVVDAGGQPVAGAAIFVRDLEGNLLERFAMNATGADGKFRYPGVSPGRYTITARGDGRASVEGDPLRVTAGETTDVTVHMVDGTMLLVTVIDRTGKEVRARVSVRDAQGREVSGMIAFSELMGGATSIDFSHQRVGPLPPGRYQVTARADDGRTVTKPVNLTGQKERKLKVRLK